MTSLPNLTEDTKALVEKVYSTLNYAAREEHRYFIIDLKDYCWFFGHHGDIIHIPKKEES